MKLKPKNLLAQVRDRVRLKLYSYKTEQAHFIWRKRNISFHKTKNPKEMGTAESEKYLTCLTTERKIDALNKTAWAPTENGIDILLYKIYISKTRSTVYAKKVDKCLSTFFYWHDYLVRLFSLLRE